jgi:chromatin remodeling complex protein RSC6
MATKRKATKRKATKRKATKRKATKRKATKRKAKKAFGGYSISFKNRVESLEQIFGKADIPPSEMTKKLWKFIKNKRLGHK